MKTINDLKKEMREIQYTVENGRDLKKREITKLRKRFAFLNTCVMYLEKSPAEALLNEHIEKVETKITNRMLGFEPNESMPKQEVTKMRQKWENEYDIPRLREQVRALRFLLR